MKTITTPFNRFRLFCIGFIFLCLDLGIQCSSEGGGSESPGGGTPTNPPQAAQLISPENQSLCLDGEEVTPVLSRVNFQWQAAENSQSYTLVVTDIESQQQQQSQLTETQGQLTLAVGKAYQWKVISRQNNSNNTAESSNWVFYLEGAPSPNYAPFPAELSFPSSGQSLALSEYPNITFRWNGSDLDNDSLRYQFYLGTSSQTLNLEAENLTATNYTHNGFSTGTYYWQVVSLDPHGNSTASTIQGFVLY